MPRLSKIRITGNRYDGFKKQYRNSIFSLDSKHTLFTLQNGSGKGAMLQLIFQLLLPGTAWGSQNGNQLENMFYNRYGEFRKYTFHVVLEWSLDGEQNKKLLSGICVSANQHKLTGEEEAKVGLKYFLYTHDYQDRSQFSLKNLPLYNKSSDQVLEYDEMEKFVDQNKAELVKYYKSSVSSLNSEYYQYLSSHGIYRSEWKIMKGINRSEGGLEKYFSKAKDNKSLFDQLIIPAVSQSISYHDHSQKKSLINLFINNIKISKDLPELLSRREDLKKLKQLVEPLLANTKKGLRLQKTKEMIRERGNNYLRGIETRINFLTNELERCQAEKDKTKKNIEKFRFETENLKYVKKLRELNDLKFKQKNVKKEKKQFELNLKELQAEELQLKLNQKKLQLDQIQKNIELKRSKINSLKKRREFKDLEAAIKELKKEIAVITPDLNAKIKKSTADYYSHHKYLTRQLKQCKGRESELDQQFRAKQKLQLKYEDQAEKLEAQKKKLANFFNPLELESPAYLLQNLEKKLEKLDSKLDEIEENLKNEKDQKEKLETKKHQLEIELAKKKSKFENLKVKLKKENQIERQLYLKLIKSLNLDEFDQFYTKQWLQQKQNELLKLITEKQQRLQDLNAKNFELQLDLNLNDQKYWIASLEQKRLYQKIKELDILVYYGSQFLFEIDKEEARKKQLNDYPLLPYSLVIISETDWEKIKNNISPAQIFHSAVPIFITYQLDKLDSELPFKLITGQEKKFIESKNNFQNWGKGLKNKKSELQKTIAVLDRKLNNLNKLNYQAEERLQEKSASELRIELELEEAELEKSEKEIKNFRSKIELKIEKINELNQSYQKKDNKLKDLKNKKQKLAEFFADQQSLDAKTARYQKVLAELEDLEQIILKNKNKLGLFQETKIKLEIDYQNWLEKYQDFITNLQEILNGEKIELQMEYKAKELKLFSKKEYPKLYNLYQHNSHQKYEEITELKQKENEKEADLKYLEKELKNELAARNQLRKELSKLAADWEQRSYNFKSENQLKIALKEIKVQSKKVEAEIESLKENLIRKKAKLEEKEKGLQEKIAEIKENFHRSVQSWEKVELKEKELEIKKELKENKEYLGKLEEMLLNYKENFQTYKDQQNRLKYYGLNSDKGELNVGIETELKDSPVVVENWITDYQNNKNKLEALLEKIESSFYKFKNDIEATVENIKLKNKIKENLLHNFRANDYEYNLENINKFKEYLNHELNKIEHDKDGAEKAQSHWAERSALHVRRLINSMKEMISKMVYHNQKGIAFPLVKLRRDDLLPDDEQEIIFELKQYFLELITKFNNQEIEVEKLSENELKKYCGDTALFSRALRGRYPILEVYKMTEKNEFLHAKPQSYFYSDWESVIRGKGKAPEGSGGQSLSINAFMMMMLLNYKKQNLDQTNPWTTLFLDNPFGKASAAHVLDPIFKIADKLNFQLIAFAAPEIIKSEISERFPVFWALEIANNHKNQGIVEGELVSGARKRKLE